MPDPGPGTSTVKNARQTPGGGLGNHGIDRDISHTTALNASVHLYILGHSKLDFSFPSGPYFKLHAGGRSISVNIHYGV